MAMSEKIDSEFFALEAFMAWLALGQEFGNTPEELTRLEKCTLRKGELVFDELQKKLNIPPGDPFTVAKALGDYLTKIGYGKFKFYKVSDTEIMWDRADCVVSPVVPIVRSMGVKVVPAPSDTLFLAAFKKLCSVKVVEEYLEADLPKGVMRKLWRFSPLN